MNYAVRQFSQGNHLAIPQVAPYYICTFVCIQYKVQEEKKTLNSVSLINIGNELNLTMVEVFFISILSSNVETTSAP
uniref:Uncharacterized protein n=1 Tax=Cucumis melo TaxID=3656 RepID=A0A9I9EEW3_CUCME